MTNEELEKYEAAIKLWSTSHPVPYKAIAFDLVRALKEKGSMLETMTRAVQKDDEHIADLKAEVERLIRERGILAGERDGYKLEAESLKKDRDSIFLQVESIREECAKIAEADYEGETHTAGPCCAPRIARMIRERAKNRVEEKVFRSVKEFQKEYGLEKCDASAPYGQLGNRIVCNQPLPCKFHPVTEKRLCEADRGCCGNGCNHSCGEPMPCKEHTR